MKFTLLIIFLTLSPFLYAEENWSIESIPFQYRPAFQAHIAKLTYFDYDLFNISFASYHMQTASIRDGIGYTHSTYTDSIGSIQLNSLRFRILKLSTDFEWFFESELDDQNGAHIYTGFAKGWKNSFFSLSGLGKLKNRSEFLHWRNQIASLQVQSSFEKYFSKGFSSGIYFSEEDYISTIDSLNGFRKNWLVHANFHLFNSKIPQNRTYYEDFNSWTQMLPQRKFDLRILQSGEKDRNRKGYLLTEFRAEISQALGPLAFLGLIGSYSSETLHWSQISYERLTAELSIFARRRIRILFRGMVVLNSNKQYNLRQVSGNSVETNVQIRL